MNGPKYLLLQIRKPEDTIREHELDCFARAIACDKQNIITHDLILSCPSKTQIDSVDAILIGGSGDYSVVDAGHWYLSAEDLLRDFFDAGKPMFASCWGFQALAKALGGTVVTDRDRAEVGSFELSMTDVGMEDSVFRPLGEKFTAQLGHQDIVEELPANAELLCSSAKVKNQAFTFADKPIYATQFHPELTKSDLIRRLSAYPEYVHEFTGMSFDHFVESCLESDLTATLVQRFVDECVK